MTRQKILCRLAGAGLLLGAALAPALLLAQPPDPGKTAPAGGRILDFASAGDTWAWLRQERGGTALYAGGPGRQPAPIARGQGWTELVLSGGDCWLLSRSDGTLLRVPLQPGASPAVVASGLSSPGGLCAAENALYWLESSGSRPGALAYVPTAGPSLRLRARDGAGQIRTVGQWPAAAGPDALPESGDIVGVRAGEACVRVRRPVSTEFVRFRLPSGEAERVAFEPGRQQGLLYRERLYWTAPSDESASDAVSQVRRQADTGETETAAEWLPPGGALLALRGRAWYASLQLYRLPLKLAPAEIHGRLPFGRVRSDGARVVVLDGPGAPSAFPMEKE